MTKTEAVSWKQATGLADDRAYARTYPTEDQKATWEEEAENHGLSLSKYIIAKVEEARSNEGRARPPVGRAEGGQIDKLEREVEKLRGKLRRERQKNAGKRQLGDSDVVHRFVNQDPQSLSEILQAIVESGCLDDFIRKPVENTLYFLAQHGEIEFDRRYGGWRLPRDDEEVERNVQ